MVVLHKIIPEIKEFILLPSIQPRDNVRTIKIHHVHFYRIGYCKMFSIDWSTQILPSSISWTQNVCSYQSTFHLSFKQISTGFHANVYFFLVELYLGVICMCFSEHSSTAVQSVAAGGGSQLEILPTI